MKNGKLEIGDKIVTTHNMGIKGKHTPSGTTCEIGKDIELDDANLMIQANRATTDLKWQAPLPKAKPAAKDK
jgi:hypothetical protein